MGLGLSFVRARKQVLSRESSLAVVLASAAWAACLPHVERTALAQDECATAVPILNGVPLSFSTLSATPSPNPPSDSLCKGYLLEWNNSPDVWFAYTPLVDGIATFTTCAPGSYDTSIALYSGTCNNLNYLACNGDSYDFSGCQFGVSEIRDFQVSAGTTYFIRIGGYGGETGNGSLTVRETEIAVWGNNTEGEWRVPTGLGALKSIASGGRHGLALQQNGVVACWGDNQSGQATPPAGISDFIAIAAGDAHSLGIRANGTVVAWGSNSAGQRNVPAGLNDAIAIAGGGHHSAAVRVNGTVVCWGSNT
jgi:alpha-tubulin suppressor-like RCC1 family protein